MVFSWFDWIFCDLGHGLSPVFQMDMYRGVVWFELLFFPEPFGGDDKLFFLSSNDIETLFWIA